MGPQACGLRPAAIPQVGRCMEEEGWRRRKKNLVGRLPLAPGPRGDHWRPSRELACDQHPQVCTALTTCVCSPLATPRNAARIGTGEEGQTGKVET
jgi:hypothetical protein